MASEYDANTQPAINDVNSRGCVIMLNGFPGVGKFSIAGSLKSKLGAYETRLFDNHLVIDPAEAVYPGRGSAHKLLRARIRQVCFEDLKKLPEKDLVILMTGCLATNAEDDAVYEEHVDIARQRGVPFYAFTLRCDPTENSMRLRSPERLLGVKRKLLDTGILEQLMKDHQLLDPTDGSHDWSVAKDVDVQHQCIDVTHLRITETADTIIEALLHH